MCSKGKCHCGSSLSLVCNERSQHPMCFNGSCICSKFPKKFVRGDGTTQGSCTSNLHQCQSDGKCAACIEDSQCTGLSDSCKNNICVCGNRPGPCNSTVSNKCSNGACKCGGNLECSGNLKNLEIRKDGENNCNYKKCSFDDKTKSCKIQRGPEVCEKISAYYNPQFTNGDVSSNGDAMNTCDDEKGKYRGEYQCLGITMSIFRRI